VEEQSGAAMGAGDVQAPQITEQQSDDTLLQASASQPPVPEEAVPEAATAPAAPETSRMSLQEIGITEYVAPTFPRGALRRNISGMVDVRFVVNVDGRTESIEVLHSEPGDVFSKSAVDAVKQWRFEPREEAIRPRITLRFDQAQ
jgi:protein TonB